MAKRKSSLPLLQGSGGTLWEVSNELYQVTRDFWLYGTDDGDHTRARRDRHGKVNDSLAAEAGRYVRLTRRVGDFNPLGTPNPRSGRVMLQFCDYKNAGGVSLPRSFVRRVRRGKDIRAAAAIVPTPFGLY